MGKSHLPIVGLILAAALSAQDSPQLAAAKALDKEIEKVNDLPETQRVDKPNRPIKEILGLPLTPRFRQYLTQG